MSIDEKREDVQADKSRQIRLEMQGGAVGKEGAPGNRGHSRNRHKNTIAGKGQSCKKMSMGILCVQLE